MIVARRKIIDAINGRPDCNKLGISIQHVATNLISGIGSRRHAEDKAHIVMVGVGSNNRSNACNGSFSNRGSSKGSPPEFPGVLSRAAVILLFTGTRQQYSERCCAD